MAHNKDPGTPRVVRIFFSSPNDVREERDVVAHLVREINDTIAFLAPERRLSLELVHYETHAYPDVGAPQEVINRQMPADYDVFVGVMWRRCGTPTKNHPSGTVEEFWRAVERRKQTGSPTVMFFFCDELIPVPNPEELKQLEGVVKFRQELQPLGYIRYYPTHQEFREYVRSGLLRAVRDILQSQGELAEAARASTSGATIPVDEAVRARILALAEEYDQIRRTMASGGERTRRMAQVFSRMIADAAAVRPILPMLQESTSAGQRLAGIAILHMFPSADQLDWLAGRLNPEQEKPFVGYQAAIGLLQAIRSLPASECKRMAAALTNARQLAELNASDRDRLSVLDRAEEELEARCKPGGGRPKA
jgi:hypothetical protein